MIERCENFERYPLQTVDGWCYATDKPIHCGGEHPLCQHLESFFPLPSPDFTPTDEDLAQMEQEYEDVVTATNKESGGKPVDRARRRNELSLDEIEASITAL